MQRKIQISEIIIEYTNTFIGLGMGHVTHQRALPCNVHANFLNNTYFIVKTTPTEQRTL